MLDAFIIDQLHKKQQQKQSQHQAQKEIDHHPYPHPTQKKEAPKRGVEIIDFSF